MTLTISLTFVFLRHPLSIGFTLLIQAILIAIITGLLSHNFWFSYILFIIIIGGILVLFIYITRVASNEKFLYSNKLAIIIITAITTILTIQFFDSIFSYQISINTDITTTNAHTEFQLSLRKYINLPSNWIIISIIIYLLVTLIAVVKITNITYGPLRQKL